MRRIGSFRRQAGAPPGSQRARQIRGPVGFVRRDDGEIPEWVERVARAGYAAKGAVYTVVGLVAALAALNAGGGTTGRQGALEVILRQPLGKVLLGLVALGLVAYVIWRFVQALVDPDGKAGAARGLARRGYYVVNGLIYAALAWAAVRLLLGEGGARDEASSQEATATLLAQPLGAWLVALVGVIVLGVAAFEFYTAYSARFYRELRTTEMSVDERTWMRRAGRFGFAARGVVFGIVGMFLIQAALQADPSETRGMAGALRELEQQPFGPWLLATVAVGLTAYGIFQLLGARYRRIRAV